MYKQLADELKQVTTTTLDGTALKEVGQILLLLNTAPEFVQEGILGYLKSRYRQPSYILTQDDIDNAGSVNEELK